MIIPDNGTVIDIFIHYEQDGAVWHGTDVHKWTNSPFELSDTAVLAHTFFIPSEPERYLDENYGDWKRPVLFWDYSFDTPNRSCIFRFQTIVLDLKTSYGRDVAETHSLKR